jgi:hypothetical protein
MGKTGQHAVIIISFSFLGKRNGIWIEFTPTLTPLLGSGQAYPPPIRGRKINIEIYYFAVEAGDCGGVETGACPAMGPRYLASPNARTGIMT